MRYVAPSVVFRDAVNDINPLEPVRTAEAASMRRYDVRALPSSPNRSFCPPDGRSAIASADGGSGISFASGRGGGGGGGDCCMLLDLLDLRFFAGGGAISPSSNSGGGGGS